MKPTKTCQIAKFHTALPGEDPNLLYVVLQVIEDPERPRAEIRALNTGLSFVPVNTVHLDDLKVVEVSTDDLLGKIVTVYKSDFSHVEGRVISVVGQNIMLDLTNGLEGIQTNVWVTIIDNKGVVHFGPILV
jgi:hypothetical protein